MEAGFAIAGTAQMHGWIYAAIAALILVVLMGAYHAGKMLVQRVSAARGTKSPL